MTRIAVFCDGTWNSPDIDETTSVHKIYQTLLTDGVPGQIPVYFKGIGVVDNYDGPIRRLLNRYGGGAFGWGLDGKVKQAYQFLCDAYSDGDEIYLFGFSRGAYTARSVAGMIRKCGLVKDPTPEKINEAFALYRKRGKRNAPDTPHIQRTRHKLSPDFATSQDDLAWRKQQDVTDGSKLVNIRYLGVFDTVGARGIPTSILGPIAAAWNRQYKFHDAALASLVKSARHALAVDERRRLFVPAKWDNLDRLNGSTSGAGRPYQQVWFVGNHRILGGSGAQSQKLSVIPLEWMMAGATGLKLRAGKSFANVAPDPVSDSPILNKAPSILGKWRDGPHREEEMHPSVRTRVRGRQDYRPKSLWRLFQGN